MLDPVLILRSVTSTPSRPSTYLQCTTTGPFGVDKGEVDRFLFSLISFASERISDEVFGDLWSGHEDNQ